MLTQEPSVHLQGPGLVTEENIIIRIPADAIVGYWKLFIDVYKR